VGGVTVLNTLLFESSRLAVDIRDIAAETRFCQIDHSLAMCGGRELQARQAVCKTAVASFEFVQGRIGHECGGRDPRPGSIWALVAEAAFGIISRTSGSAPQKHRRCGFPVEPELGIGDTLESVGNALQHGGVVAHECLK